VPSSSAVGKSGWAMVSPGVMVACAIRSHAARPACDGGATLA